MPRKPNYRFERAERDRAKKAKKDEKLRRRQQGDASPQEDGPSREAEPQEPADP
jgi:hypothetical protein